MNSSPFSGDKCCLDTCIHKPEGHHLTEGTKVNLGQVKYNSQSGIRNKTVVNIVTIILDHVETHPPHACR